MLTPEERQVIEEHVDRLPHLPGEVVAAGRVIRRAGYTIVKREALDELRDRVRQLTEDRDQARALHKARVLHEHDDINGYETGELLPPICEACTRPDLIEALDEGELIEPGEAAPWPCRTIQVIGAGEDQ